MPRFKPNVEKTAFSKMKTHWLLMLCKICLFLEYPNFIKVNSPKHICLRTTHGLFADKTAMKLI